MVRLLNKFTLHFSRKTLDSGKFARELITRAFIVQRGCGGGGGSSSCVTKHLLHISVHGERGTLMLHRRWCQLACVRAYVCACVRACSRSIRGVAFCSSRLSRRVATSNRVAERFAEDTCLLLFLVAYVYSAVAAVFIGFKV